MHRIVVIGVATLLAGGTAYLWHARGPRSAEASLTSTSSRRAPDAIYLPNHTRQRAVPQLPTATTTPAETPAATTTTATTAATATATAAGDLAETTARAPRRGSDRIHMAPGRLDRARLEAKLAKDKQLTDEQRRQIRRVMSAQQHKDPIPGASAMRAHLLGPCAGRDVQKRYDALAEADKPAMRAQCARFGIELH